MATLASNVLTLMDWAKRIDPDGKTVDITEILGQTNEVLEDMMFMEGNLPTGHRFLTRTGLPTTYWRLINQGVPASKSTTAQVDEACAMLEARSNIDAKLLALNGGNESAFRLSEDTAFIESMNQTMAETIFYGSASDPKTFVGLSNRYNSLSAGNGENILNGGGSGSDNTSVWLVVWGAHSMFGIFPKGSKAGLSHRDLGEEDVNDASGNPYRAARSLYQWDTGLAVKDWRYAVRIANIDVSNLVSESSAANLFKLMSRAIDRIPNLRMGKACFYANRTVHSMLRIQALNTSSGVVKVEEALSQFGNPVGGTVKFLGIPVRKVDKLLNTEATVS